MQPKESLSRREVLLGAGAAMLCSPQAISSASAQDGPDDGPSPYKEGMFYSIEAMEEIYKRKYNGNKPFRFPVTREGGALISTYQKYPFTVPHRFVDELLRQITEMLKDGAATYIFRLDAYHGHLFVAPDIAQVRYSSFSFPQDFIREIETTLGDPDLQVLHHTYEHLTQPKQTDPMYEKYIQRNVVGFFNGKKNESMPMPKPPLVAQPEPGPSRIPNLVYAAHKNGLFAITHPLTGEEIRIDISFEDSSWYR